MKRLIMLASLALAVMPITACVQPSITDPATAGAVGSVIDSAGVGLPSTLDRSTADEKGLLAVNEALTFASISVDQLVDSGRIIPGTPLALKLRGYFVAARDWYNVAAAAQRAGSANDYANAMTEISKAMTLAKQALKEGA